MDNFSEKTRRDVLEAYNGFCCVKDCYRKAVDFHHPLHNTEYNRKKFPLLIESPFNCKPVCREHHNSHGKYSELTVPIKLAEVYEEYLNSIVEDGMRQFFY